MSQIFLLACLLLPQSVLAQEQSGAPSPPVYFCEGGGLAAPRSLSPLEQRSLPPLRDMALNRFGDLLLLSRDGDLLHMSREDSLILAPFSGDLEEGAWPEAVAADGLDWLLLSSQGRTLLRLGRRGEALALIAIPEQESFWRGLEVDRSGRIWLAEETGGRFALLSRGGQALQFWDLEERLPGFNGPIRAWCPDEQGGLYVAEGWPAVQIHHLNAAGNVLASWQPQLPAGDLALCTDEWERLLIAVAPEGSEARLFYRRLWKEIFLASGDTLWILESPGKDP